MVDTKPELASYARVSYARELLGQIPAAVDAMRMAYRAAGTASDRAWAAFQLGELEWNRGRVESARDWYRSGLRLDERFVPNEAGLAKVAWARGDLDTAVARYDDVVARYPSVEYLTAFGDLYASMGEHDLAREQYAVVDATRRLQEADGVDVDLEIALFEADHGDPAAAVRAARAEWSRRHSIHVADAYAWALYRAGRAARAEPFAERALSLGTRNATFLFHAGMIERELEHRAEGLRLLRAASTVNPNFSVRYSGTVRRIVARAGGAR
jgi:tetratricopeptide (TPR) repeat protein